MEIIKVLSSRGKECIIINNFKFRKINNFKNGDASWRCTVRLCSSRARTNAAVTDVLFVSKWHNHKDLEDRDIEKIVVTDTCKRKAVEDISATPNKIIRTALKSAVNLNIQHADINDIRQAMYRSRRKKIYQTENCPSTSSYHPDEDKCKSETFTTEDLPSTSSYHPEGDKHIITAAEIYVKKLQNLDENIKKAENQILDSGNESINSINEIFTNLKKTLINVLDVRQRHLEDNIKKLQNDGIKPLRECQTLISEKIDKTNNLITQGNNILSNSNHQIDNQDNFYLQSSLLGNLPAVPSLLEVPFIHFTYSENAQNDIVDLCKNLGAIFRQSPVQITSLIEKPGSILIQWEENDIIIEEKLNNIQEFRLQYAFGDITKNPNIPVNYNDCYIGSNTEFLMKDLKLNQPYSFRICCKMDNNSDWSPWSLSQIGKTTIKPFCWLKNLNGFSLNNDDKLATKVVKESAFLLSDGGQFHPDYSLEFTILEIEGSASEFAVGLCDQIDVQLLNENNYCTLNTFIVTKSGGISVGGKEKSTKLPMLKKGSKISFTCEEVNDKVRISVDMEEKNVTYDWKVSNNEKIYFFVWTESQIFKILVE